MHKIIGIVVTILFLMSACVVGGYWLHTENQNQRSIFTQSVPLPPSEKVSPTLIIVTRYPSVTNIPTRNVNKKCVIGGCSGQSCQEIEQSNIATTCEWQEKYACFRTAECTRQSSGECGWTQTEDLKKCLEQYR